MATLYDLAQAYLNRGLPDISGIYGNNTNNTLAPIDFGGEEPVSPQGLTPEQLSLLYSQYNNSQYNNGGGEGDADDGDNTIGDGSNLGINSISDAFGAITDNINPGSVLGGILGGPLGAFLGNKAYGAFGGIGGITAQNAAAQKSAAAIGAAKQAALGDKGIPNSYTVDPKGKLEGGPNENTTTSTVGSFGTRGPGMTGYGGGADGAGGGGGYGDTYVCTASYANNLITPLDFKTLKKYGINLRRNDKYLMKAYDWFGPKLAAAVKKGKLVNFAKHSTSMWKYEQTKKDVSFKIKFMSRLHKIITRPILRALGALLTIKEKLTK